MHESELVDEAAVTLTRTLDTGYSPDYVPDARRPTSLEELKAFLVPRISALLDKNPGYLMSILYRIDVDEEKVKRVLNDCPFEDIASQLAELMIDRELQKIKTRHHRQRSV